VAELRAFVRRRGLSIRAAQIAKTFCAKMKAASRPTELAENGNYSLLQIGLRV
jgi:hypothetical protein